jgi:hypothetical protein
MRRASKIGFQLFGTTAAIVLCEDVLDLRRQRLQTPHLCLLPHNYCTRLNNAIQQIKYFQSGKTALTVGFADKKFTVGFAQ